jgi:tubulin monoglycylase TTLL15
LLILFVSKAVSNPEKLWVQKDSSHRGIKIKNLEDLDLDASGTFVQEYIRNPLLIDGK